MEHYRHTATGVAAKIKSGELTVVEYAISLLSRIEHRDPAVKAWAYLDPEQVLAEAKWLDKVLFENRGPLYSVGAAVKNITYTKGKYRTRTIGNEYITDCARYAHLA